MFELKQYEDRLASWSAFREKLETSKQPLNDVMAFYQQSPLYDLQTDPYDKTTWADPWTLVLENRYCQFNRVLGMCYSLQLTERFYQSNYEIHISIDDEKSETHYLLKIDSKVLNYSDKVISLTRLPKSLHPIEIHSIPCLQ